MKPCFTCNHVHDPQRTEHPEPFLPDPIEAVIPEWAVDSAKYMAQAEPAEALALRIVLALDVQDSCDACALSSTRHALLTARSALVMCEGCLKEFIDGSK